MKPTPQEATAALLKEAFETIRIQREQAEHKLALIQSQLRTPHNK